MSHDRISNENPKEAFATDAELRVALQWRPEFRGKSIRAIQMLLRRERRMKLAAKLLGPSKADKGRR
jgi:hypothetical protein